MKLFSILKSKKKNKIINYRLKIKNKINVINNITFDGINLPKIKENVLQQSMGFSVYHICIYVYANIPMVSCYRFSFFLGKYVKNVKK